MTVSVDLLYVPDCPNVPVARQRIAEAIAATGVAAEVHERVVADQDAAAAMGMSGSPTVLVDGRDVTGEAAGSVSCRLHTPTVDQIVEALASRGQ